MGALPREDTERAGVGDPDQPARCGPPPSDLTQPLQVGRDQLGIGGRQVAQLACSTAWASWVGQRAVGRVAADRHHSRRFLSALETRRVPVPTVSNPPTRHRPLRRLRQ